MDEPEGRTFLLRGFSLLVFCPHGCGGAVQRVEHPATMLGLRLMTRHRESLFYYVQAVF